MQKDLIKLAANYLAKGNLTKSIATCNAILAEQPDSVMAYLILAQSLHGESAWDVAKKAYLKAIELDPKLFMGYFGLANLCTTSYSLDDAIFYYRQALLLRDDVPDVYYNLGVALHSQGNLTEAGNYYKKSIEIAPKYYKSYYNLATLLQEQGDSIKAVEIYQKLLEIKPDYLKVYNNLGCILINLDRVDDALAVYAKGLEFDPLNWSIYNNICHALSKKPPDEALAAFERAIALNPQLTPAYYNIGKIYQLQNCHDEAIMYFQHIVQLEPDHILAYSDCGFSLMLKGNFPAAMAYFQKAIELKPDFVIGYCHWANSIQEDDELARAKKSCANFLQALLALGNNNNINQLIPIPSSQIYTYLAQTYIHLGNAIADYGSVDMALYYYQKGLQLEPKLPEIYLTLSKFYAKKKKWNTTIILAHLALKLAKYDQSITPQIWLILAKTLEQQGKFTASLDYYQKIFTWQEEHPNQKLIADLNLSLNSSSIFVPEGVYVSTWDWLVNHNLPNNYRKIVWENDPIDQEIIAPITAPKSNEECGGLSCVTCLKKINEWFNPVDLGLGIYRCSNQIELPIKPVENFVATIPNGRVWVVPNRNHWLICKAIAVISIDNYLLADLSRYYPGKLPGCQADDPTKHTIFTDTDNLGNVEFIDGRVAVLTGLSSNVYFHWLIDILPRIELLRVAGIDFAKIDYFYVNSYQQNFQKETLNILGIPAHKIIEADAHPHIQASQLIAPSFPSYLGWSSPWIIDFLRRTFLTDQALNNHTFKRLYISRQKANHRRVFNETEVENLLREYGFMTVYLEGMSVQDQVALFANVDVVIAPHGSALANTIFCRPGTKVLEFVSPHYMAHYYWVSSAYLQLDHYYLTGEVFECYPIRQLMYQTPLTEDILVNLSYLEKMLQLAGITKDIGY